MSKQHWARKTAMTLASCVAWGGAACVGPQEPAPPPEQEAPAGEAASAATQCVTFQRGTHGAVQDALISNVAGKQTKNYGTSGSLTESAGAANGPAYGLVQWDLSEIPRRSTISSATLGLTRTIYGGSTLRVHAVTGAWSEADVTYSSFNDAFDPTVSATIADTAPAQIPPQSGAVALSTDIATLVQGWIDNPTSNHGILLERVADGITVLASSDVASVGQRPKLDVCFTPPPPCPCAGGAIWDSTLATSVSDPNVARYFGPQGVVLGGHAPGSFYPVYALSALNGATDPSFPYPGSFAASACQVVDAYTGDVVETHTGITDAEAASCAADLLAWNDVWAPCQSDPCADGTCSPSGASFTCHCPVGISGTLCEIGPPVCPSALVNGPYEREAGPSQLNAFSKMRLTATFRNDTTSNFDFTQYDTYTWAEALSGHRYGDLPFTYVQRPTGIVPPGGLFSYDIVIDTSGAAPGAHKLLFRPREGSGFGDLPPIYAGLVSSAIDCSVCAAAPCQNGGACTASGSGYTCACVNGYTGANCEVAPDPCGLNPCQNGGTCTANGSSYTCDCQAPYSGTSCEALGASCDDILVRGLSTGDGLYTIDADGAGPKPSLQVFCDMTREGGGWTLVLAYNHFGGENNPLVLAPPDHPMAGYSHMSTAQMQALAPFNDARFHCSTNAHNRIVDFTTSNAGALDYIRNGGANDPSYWNTGFTPLPGHTATIPGSVASTFSGQGDYAMTNFPFWQSGVAHWGIQGGGSRWECDDFANGAQYSTLHNIWVRNNVDDCAANPCQNGGTCTDAMNGYTCTCPPGFSGTNCEVIAPCAGYPDGTACNDNDACTSVDTCQGGLCVGSANYALQFDTANLRTLASPYVRIPSTTALAAPAAYTIDGQIYWTGGQGYRVWLSKPRGTAASEAGTGYAIALNNGRPVLAMAGLSVANRTLTAPSAIPANTWVRVTGTYTGSVMTLYVNGAQVATTNFGITAAANTGTTSLVVGREFINVPSLQDRTFPGYVEEVRIWNRALSASEVQGLTTCGLSPSASGLIGYWTFDEGTGTSVADATGLVSNGTLVNNPSWLAH